MDNQLIIVLAGILFVVLFVLVKQFGRRRHINKPTERNGKITPICTNTRYDGTNKALNFNIGELGKQNLPGEIIVKSDGEIVYRKKFEKLFDLPMGYAIPYVPKKENEKIETILTLAHETVSDVIILNAESTRNPITWNEWLDGNS
tara:strand:+ start:141 stop:578 length:438 start_codon:yes stop_codon:yes gene_type:complete